MDSTSAGPPNTPDRLRLDLRVREVMGRLATAVAVVTTISDGGPVGLTVNSFTSVSLDPPAILVCINRTNRGHAAVAAAQSFTVNLLGGSQAWIAELFATPGLSQSERFAKVRWTAGRLGPPVLDDVSGWMECSVSDRHVSGTHEVFIADVVAADSDVWAEVPLVYFQRRMFPLSQPDRVPRSGTR